VRLRVRVDEERSVPVVIEKPRGFDAARGLAVVLGHGAGNDMESPFLVTIADGIRRAGHAAVRFDFPYKAAGRKAPDPRPRLEATYRAVLAAVRKRLAPAALVIGGKSMGGRIASYLAAAGEAVDGCLFLGYPLHPAGKPDRLRDDHFGDVRVPALFVQGDRDALGTAAELRASLRRFGAEASLHEVADGDHSFRVRKRSGRTDEEALADALAAVVAWLEERRPGR
jgi:predicted alpha/beta-hydrolase family hydrolase